MNLTKLDKNVQIMQYAEDFIFCILNALSDIKILICDFAKESGKFGLCIYEQKSKICLFNKSRKEFTVKLDDNGVILTNKGK